jgi:hypothetical protein
VVDFYGQIKRDRAKDAYLKSVGIRVLRLPSGLVTENPEEFVKKIRERYDSAAPQRALTRPRGTNSGTNSPRGLANVASYRNHSIKPAWNKPERTPKNPRAERACVERKDGSAGKNELRPRLPARLVA